MQRELRCYISVARTQHWCDRCCEWILPGETYEGSVQLHEGRGIIVFKTHVNPVCDPPPDPDEEESDEEADLDEAPMKLAA